MDSFHSFLSLDEIFSDENTKRFKLEEEDKKDLVERVGLLTAPTNEVNVTAGIKGLHEIFKTLNANGKNLASGEPVKIIAGLTSVAATVATSTGDISKMLKALGVASGVASPLLGPIGAGLSLVASILGTVIGDSTESPNTLLVRQIAEISDHYFNRKAMGDLRADIYAADLTTIKINELGNSKDSKEQQTDQIRDLLTEITNNTLGKAITKFSSYAISCATTDKGELAENGYTYISLLPLLYLKLTVALLALEANQYFPDSHQDKVLDRAREEAMMQIKEAIKPLTKPLNDTKKCTKGHLKIFEKYATASKDEIAATQIHAKMCGLKIRGTIFTLKSSKHGNYVVCSNDSAKYAEMAPVISDGSDPTTTSVFVAFPLDESNQFIDTNMETAMDKDQTVFIYAPSINHWMQNNYRSYFYGDREVASTLTSNQHRFNLQLRSNNLWRVRWNFDNYDQYLHDVFEPEESVTAVNVPLLTAYNTRISTRKARTILRQAQLIPERRELYFAKLNCGLFRSYEWEVDFKNLVS